MFGTSVCHAAASCRAAGAGYRPQLPLRRVMGETGRHLGYSPQGSCASARSDGGDQIGGNADLRLKLF